MWIDDDGVTHTAALPDPSDVMSEEFRTGLDALVVAHRLDVADVLQQAEARLVGQDLSDLVRADRQGSHFHGVAPQA